MRSVTLAILIMTFPLLAFSQLNKAADASNRFGFNLYKHTAKEPGNLFFSPLSIEVALAMTSAGAQQETLKQMLSTLQIGPHFHSEFRDLLSQFHGSPHFQLFIANRIWGQSGTPYNSNFLKLLIDNYKADLAPLDFRKQPEPSRAVVNRWVEQQTRDKIQDLLPPGSITPLTDLVLTNAIYFKGSWNQEFKKELTKPDIFHVSAQGKKSVPFMNMVSDFPYTENSELQYVQLLYKGNELVMDIILPKPGIALSTLEQKLDLTAFINLTKFAVFEEVKLVLPKFKAEAQLDLAATLSALGMPLAFNPVKANFQGIRKIEPGKNIFISKVVHKGFVDVNEEGTEAAAATGAIIAVSTSIPEEPKLFKADRPFLYFIRHLKTGTILFMGRLSQP